MLVVYDLEDANPSINPPPFMKREVVAFIYVRTDSFDKTKMQNWVKKTDGSKVAGPTGKNWVYNHYVPHSRIYKAIEDLLLAEPLSREDAVERLLNVTSKLKILPDEKLQEISWETNRMAYDIWMDWAVSAICDWKDNIFYGPGSGDHKGTTLDVPDDATQNKRVKAAAARLAKLIPNLSLEKTIPAEKQFQDPKNQTDEYDGKLDPGFGKLWWQILNSPNLPEQDVDDGDFNPEEEDGEELFANQDNKLKIDSKAKKPVKFAIGADKNQTPYKKAANAVKSKKGSQAQNKVDDKTKKKLDFSKVN